MNRSIELAVALLPFCGLTFVWSERLGFWDWWLGLDLVEDVATRFETSYAEGVDRQVGRDEKAWEPLLDLIERYSPAELPQDREPKMLARMPAVQSNKILTPGGGIAEWTAPTTPILLLYKDREAILTENDVCLVGSIGDLRVWVTRRRDDFRFLAHDISITLASVALALLLWFGGSGKGSQSDDAPKTVLPTRVVPHAHRGKRSQAGRKDPNAGAVAADHWVVRLFGYKTLHLAR